MQVSIGRDFQKVWDRFFPNENLNDFYSKIFDIYDESPDEQLKYDVVQAHAALFRHEYGLSDPNFEKPKDAAIKDAVIAKALIHAIHQRNGQHFVERSMRPFDNDAQPWLSGTEIQHTMALLEHTGVNFCALHLHNKRAPDGRDCHEMHEAPENKRLTAKELDIVRQQFGDRSADQVSRSFIDNSGLEPYAGQHIEWGIEELLTDPERSSRYPPTETEIAEKRDRLNARFKPENLDV